LIISVSSEGPEKLRQVPLVCGPGFHGLLSEAVALSALERRESRGAHSRIDYTSYDEGWSKQNNIVARDGTAMSLSQRPISEMPAELKQIVDEGK